MTITLATLSDIFDVHTKIGSLKNRKLPIECKTAYLYELNTLPIICTIVNIHINTHGVILPLSPFVVNNDNNTAACPISNAIASTTAK